MAIVDLTMTRLVGIRAGAGRADPTVWKFDAVQGETPLQAENAHLSLRWSPAMHWQQIPMHQRRSSMQ